jgi:titin
MTSTNGETWTARSAAEASTWRSVAYANGLFVAVASAGTNRVMTSGAYVLPTSAPDAPTSLVATAGDGSASIAFTAGADGGAEITKYQVKVGAGAWTDVVGTTSPITVTGLTNYQTANIRLRAVNSAGDGDPSALVKVWPRLAGSSLTSVKAQSATRIRAAFAALTPVGGTVSHYWVYAYAKDTNTVVSSCRSSAAARSCVVTGLGAGTEYDIAVRGFFTLTGSPALLQTLDSAKQTVRTKN